jgi:hypothetical protein
LYGKRGNRFASGGTSSSAERQLLSEQTNDLADMSDIEHTSRRCLHTMEKTSTFYGKPFIHLDKTTR